MVDDLKKKELQILKDNVNSFKIVKGDCVLLSISILNFSGEI